MHTESSGSFATPEFGPLGVVDAGTVMLRRAAAARARRGATRTPSAGLRVRRLETRVELLQAYTGMSDRLVRVRRRRRRCAAWRSSPSAAATCRRRSCRRSSDAIAAGMLVTVSSRCVAGRVSPRYGYEGGGLHLAQIGAILAGDLSGAKARLLQMVALGSHRQDIARGARRDHRATMSSLDAERSWRLGLKGACRRYVALTLPAL